MATRTGFNKIEFWSPNKLKGLAQRYKAVFDKRVFEDGKDKDGRKFKKYSKGYEKLLNKDYRKKDGARYKGFEGMSLTTGGNKLSKRQPQLRGITRLGLDVGNIGRDYFQLTIKGEAGAIAEGLAGQGRDFINDIPNKEKTWLINGLGKLVDKEYNKIPKVINIR